MPIAGMERRQSIGSPLSSVFRPPSSGLISGVFRRCDWNSATPPLTVFGQFRRSQIAEAQSYLIPIELRASPLPQGSIGAFSPIDPFRPVLHQRASLFEQVRSVVSSFSGALNGVGKCAFSEIAWVSLL